MGKTGGDRGVFIPEPSDRSVDVGSRQDSGAGDRPWDDPGGSSDRSSYDLQGAATGTGSIAPFG